MLQDREYGELVFLVLNVDLGADDGGELLSDGGEFECFVNDEVDSFDGQYPQTPVVPLLPGGQIGIVDEGADPPDVPHGE